MATHNFRTLTPGKATKVVYELLSSVYTRRFRILFHGAPGVGKSAVMKVVAMMMGATLIDLRLLQLDLGALRGLEHIYTDPKTGSVETHPARPYFLPPYVRDEDITDETPRYIIFLDEIMAADDAIRKAAFEMLTEHRVGPHLLGNNVWIVGAGNSAEDGTQVYEMDRATARRFLHILIESNHEELIDHAIKTKWHHHMISFLRNNPGLIGASDEDITNNNLAVPCPASHESVSQALYAYDAGDIGKETRDIAIAGWIGNYAAEIMITALDDEESKFDLLKLVSVPKDERVYPQNSFGMYSLASALAAYADTPEKLDRAVGVMMEIPEGTVDVIDECKVAFIYNIAQKLKEWRLFPKYALDPRVKPFLGSTEEIVNKADSDFEKRQAEAQEALRQAA